MQGGSKDLSYRRSHFTDPASDSTNYSIGHCTASSRTYSRTPGRASTDFYTAPSAIASPANGTDI